MRLSLDIETLTTPITQALSQISPPPASGTLSSQLNNAAVMIEGFLRQVNQLQLSEAALMLQQVKLAQSNLVEADEKLTDGRKDEGTMRLLEHIHHLLAALSSLRSRLHILIHAGRSVDASPEALKQSLSFLSRSAIANTRR